MFDGVCAGSSVCVCNINIDLYIASASSVVMCGAKPVFADVDRDSQNITADTIEK
ncbi:MAG: DegT/DnrJ/EryC1/StrS family aminotransferase, partial [Smithella sp.]